MRDKWPKSIHRLRRVDLSMFTKHRGMQGTIACLGFLCKATKLTHWRFHDFETEVVQIATIWFKRKGAFIEFYYLILTIFWNTYQPLGPQSLWYGRRDEWNDMFVTKRILNLITSKVVFDIDNDFDNNGIWCDSKKYYVYMVTHLQTSIFLHGPGWPYSYMGL